MKLHGVHHAGPGAPKRLIGMLWLLPMRQDESRWRTG